jgi:hypothetical protein
MKTILFITLLSFSAFGADNHDEHSHEAEEKAAHKEEHGKEEDHAHSDSEKHDEHEGKEDEHAGHDEHGEEEGGHEEENSAIGPNKGILAKGPNGFKLSPEAVKNFGFKTADINSKVLTLPKQALVHVKAEKFVYRIRDEWIKRLSVKVINKNPTTVTVEIPEYTANDKIIISGNGFIRTTEIVVEEGATEGHSH